MDWITAALFYLLGAFTFIPLVLWLAQLYITVYQSSAPCSDYSAEQQDKTDVITGHNYGTKEGWVLVSSNYQPITSSIKRHLVPGGKAGYGVFKQGILKIYSNESKHRCEWTLDLNEYDVSIYPPGRQEHTLFSRSVALRLLRKQQQQTPTSSSSSFTSSSDQTIIQDNELYFTCTRPIDKEDWYFAFMSVANTSSSGQHRAIPFDPMAVASLISFVGKEKYQHHTDDMPIPWFNAVLGRTFLGIYKTQRLQQYVFETLAKKTLKMKTPGFLGDIQVRSVDLGYAIPFVTNPSLVELCPDGTLVLDALVDYRGGFKVVVEASAGGGGASFSIRVPLVLSLTLQSLSGTIRFKIKPPPSNRYWIGFCTMPTMKWSILPAVSNYNVKLSMVSKIIEAKIRRMMTENMVLPNMADIPFAKSDGKGGIFHPLNDTGNDETGLGDVGSSGDDDGEEDDTALRHSFIINSSTNTPDSTLTDALSSSPSSGRWSKLFANRRRKTNTTATAVDDKSGHDEHDNGKISDQQNGKIKQDQGDDSSRIIDTENDTMSMGEFGGPMYLSPSSTASTLIKRSSASSLTATESTPITLHSSSSTTTLGTEDDTSSTRSTPKKRIYNAAGYLLSKGKGLANDFREYRQQDLQLKRQQSLLQYNDQLEDMRRRCDENTQQRRRRSSSNSDTTAYQAPPPFHLIHNYSNEDLVKPQTEKPPLPPRPTRSTKDELDLPQSMESDITISKDGIQSSTSSSPPSATIPFMDPPPMIPTTGNT